MRRLLVLAAGVVGSVAVIAAVAPGAGAGGSAWTEDRWQSLALDRSYGASLGTGGLQAFNESLRQADAIGRCGPRWVRPPGITSYRAELEIRLRGVAGGYEVEDVRAPDAGVSDPDLESCLREAYLPVTIPVADAKPGRRARLAFPLAMHAKRAR